MGWMAPSPGLRLVSFATLSSGRRRGHHPGRVALEPGRAGIEITTRNLEIKVAWFQNRDRAGGCRCHAISRSRDP
jgi:hypothetical protein